MIPQHFQDCAMIGLFIVAVIVLVFSIVIFASELVARHREHGIRRDVLAEFERFVDRYKRVEHAPYRVGFLTRAEQKRRRRDFRA